MLKENIRPLCDISSLKEPFEEKLSVSSGDDFNERTPKFLEN